MKASNTTWTTPAQARSPVYDAIGRLTGAGGYTSSASYNATSQLTGVTYGNNVSASFGYSADRLQMTSLVYTKSGSNLLSLSYSYSQSGSNNGQIAGITDNVQGGRTATYTYDVLHRLKTAATNGSAAYAAWGLQWTYDRYGNRKVQSKTTGTPPEVSLDVSASTNQITNMGAFSFTYDANGNLTQDDLYKYKYDAENRMVELRLVNNALVATYAYDGNSLRVIKVVGADRTWYLYSGTSVVSEFEDAASATYNSGTTPGQTTTDAGAVLLYQHSDHLTTRLTTENSGQLSNEQAHYPYGDNWYNTGDANPSVMKKFTSYEKDTEASAGQIHYAVFREHGARIGRFHTADPVQGSSNPQRLNRYAYVIGDPSNRVDPSGLEDEGQMGGMGDMSMPAPAPSPGPCGGETCILIDTESGGREAVGMDAGLGQSCQFWGTCLDMPWMKPTGKPDPVYGTKDPPLSKNPAYGGGSSICGQCQARCREDLDRSHAQCLNRSPITLRPDGRLSPADVRSQPFSNCQSNAARSFDACLVRCNVAFQCNLSGVI